MFTHSFFLADLHLSMQDTCSQLNPGQPDQKAHKRLLHRLGTGGAPLQANTAYEG